MLVDIDRQSKSGVGDAATNVERFILTVLGIGIEIVSSNALEEIAPPLAAVGAVVIALGVGFIVSAVLAYILTRRFGLLNNPNASPDTRG